ncbi:MAG: translation initiation factor IF-2 [Oscillospiraceae bacterium]|nr:translation initiation factor IF-2 [Oscillospiraceae bacterium]
MIDKYRVHEVAKDLSVSNKDVLNVLTKYYPDDQRKHMTALSDNELNLVFDHFTQKNSIKNLDDYFALASKKQEAEAPKTEAAAKPAEKTAESKKPQQNANQNKGQKQPAQQNKPQQQAQQRPAAQQPAAAPAAEQPISNKVERRASRHVDMRSAQVNLDKYNERYENMGPSNLNTKNMGPSKQKFTGRQQKGKPARSRMEKEAEKMRRLELERQRRQKLEVTLPDELTVGELALRLKVQAAEIVKRLMGIGVFASASQVIDYDTAALVAMEIGAKVEREVVVTIEDRLFDEKEDVDEALEPRCPVVVVMGHVDHGKTSLLDAIRKTNVTSGEAGGITQHIGAYQVQFNDRPITFLDTPGHAAFTSMRARGAQVTDIAVLVVAADDGIMPQTVEAINHAKAAGVSIIVAINKMDKPTANPERVKQELTEYELVPEEWGGDVICIPISAKTGMGIDDLLEMILLVADTLELKANPDRAAKGTVIESKLDKGRGPVATVLVQNGTLHAGDVVIAGTALGHVRIMLNDKGEKITSAGPSTPVEITGLSEVPAAGDILNAVADERLAKELVDKRRHEAKEEQFKSYQKVTLDNLFSQISEGEMKELPIIVKADVDGSVEAVRQSLEKLSNEEVKVRVIHGAVGAVNESDVMLANASNAIIIGFNVRPEPSAKLSAERDNVDMRLYRVIYDAINDVTDALKGMLAPKIREKDLGRAEVRQVYKISSVGTVAGCYVLEGKISRTALIRVVRDGIIIADDKLDSLKRFKDDVKEVNTGYECGMTLMKFADIKEGDIFEAYELEEYRD